MSSLQVYVSSRKQYARIVNILLRSNHQEAKDQNPKELEASGSS